LINKHVVSPCRHTDRIMEQGRGEQATGKPHRRLLHRLHTNAPIFLPFVVKADNPIDFGK
jgi:hypothetical protein